MNKTKYFFFFSPIVELVVVLQFDYSLEPTFTGAEQHVPDPVTRVQAARRGWMGGTSFIIPTSDTRAPGSSVWCLRPYCFVNPSRRRDRLEKMECAVSAGFAPLYIAPSFLFFFLSHKARPDSCPSPSYDLSFFVCVFAPLPPKLCFIPHSHLSLASGSFLVV